jgi:lysozyme
MAKRRRTPIKRKRKQAKGKGIWIAALAVCLGVGSWYIYDQYFSTKKIIRNSLVDNIPSGYTSFGIDVSHHQGTIDWLELFNTEHYDTIVHFVYCKATEGNTHIDTRWEENRKTLNNMGIPNGAYHFFATKDPPRPQVAHFLNYWEKREVDLPPVLDVETEGFSDEDLRAKMTIWLEEVERLSGMRPIIYTSLNFYETKFKNHFPNYKFWIAAYSRVPDIKNDKRVLHWQYSENGTLPGIKERVDFNVSKITF